MAPPAASSELPRKLTLFVGAALLVAGVIGSGIFVVPLERDAIAARVNAHTALVAADASPVAPHDRLGGSHDTDVKP